MDSVYVLKALADENRIRILNLLRSGELCGYDIELVLGVKQSNASGHLNKLRMAGISVCKEDLELLKKIKTSGKMCD
jgi:ArsR family transcriptional regulator